MEQWAADIAAPREQFLRVRCLAHLSRGHFLPEPEPWTFKMSFELSAFANYVTYICKNLSLSLSLCVMSTLHIVMHLFSVHIICQNLKKCPGHLCHTCVCVCVCVCMLVPCCICALDPGLYKNVKHFRFILGVLLFSTNEKNFSFSLFPFIFNVDLKLYFFYTHL